MLQNILASVLIFLCSGSLAYVSAQGTDAALKPSYIAGEVTAIAAKKITISAKTGPLDIIITDKTAFKHASAENPNLTTATPGVMTDISVGDKVTVSGILAADGKSMPARSVYFVTKADVAAKNAKESGEWKTRGIAGKVTSVTTAGQINVEIRSLMGSTAMVLTPKADAKFVRYAPDSERFDEAKPSSLTEVKAGDMIRALGDKSADGTGFAAETVLTGAFQTVAGTVVSVDAAKNEVVIKNLQTKKDVTVVVGDTSVLKKFPAEMAERMAGGMGGGGTGPRPVTPGGGQGAQPPAGGQAPGGQGRGGFGGRGAGGGGIDDMLERFPNITAADLKPGDMIAVSSTKSGDMDRIRAIKLLAGVEPFIRMAQAGNGGGRRQGQAQSADSGFTIPGLDGIGFP